MKNIKFILSGSNLSTEGMSFINKLIGQFSIFFLDSKIVGTLETKLL